MLVVQRRRCTQPCVKHTDFYPLCYSDAGEDTTRLTPGNQYWHTYNRDGRGYLLPVDIGLMGVTKDAGLCSLRLAQASGWVDDRATREIVVRFVTFNPQVARWGLGSASFSFDLAGGAASRLEAFSAAVRFCVQRHRTHTAVRHSHRRVASRTRL
jgi:hypothetical protein